MASYGICRGYVDWSGLYNLNSVSYEYVSRFSSIDYSIYNGENIIFFFIFIYYDILIQFLFGFSTFTCGLIGRFHCTRGTF